MPAVWEVRSYERWACTVAKLLSFQLSQFFFPAQKGELGTNVSACLAIVFLNLHDKFRYNMKENEVKFQGIVDSLGVRRLSGCEGFVEKTLRPSGNKNLWFKGPLRYSVTFSSKLYRWRKGIREKTCGNCKLRPEYFFLQKSTLETIAMKSNQRWWRGLVLKRFTCGRY